MSEILADFIAPKKAVAIFAGVFCKSLHLRPHQAPMQGDGRLSRVHKRKTCLMLFGISKSCSFFGTPFNGISQAEKKPPQPSEI